MKKKKIKRMNPYVKKLWIKDLRKQRTKIRQGYGLLSTLGDDGVQYDCCLGRLCWLAVEEGVIKKPRFFPDTQTYSFEGRKEILPKSVMEWAGLSSLYGDYMDKEYDSLVSLTKKNDEEKLPFKEIARIIKKYL